MLLSITIDTTHPDAQGDARTAIKLLHNTFPEPRIVAVEHDIDYYKATVRVGFDGSATTPAFDVGVVGFADDTLSTTPETLITPDLMQGFKDASDSARQMDAALGARVIPGVVPGDDPKDRKMLIPGTDTYVPVDVNGLPWDKRIHASTQAFVADGSWRRKPKVSDEDFKRISDELHVVITAPEAPVLTVAAMTAAEAFAQPAIKTFASGLPVPPNMSACVMPAPTTFIDFMTWIGGHSHAQRLTLTNVSDVMAELGLVNAEGRGAVALIDKRPDLIRAAYARLSALLPAGEG